MKLTFAFEKDGDKIVAHCVELGTASQGNDLAEAVEMIADATAVYIRTCQDLGQWPPTRLKIEELLARLKASPSVVETVEICTRITELSRMQREMKRSGMV